MSSVSRMTTAVEWSFRVRAISIHMAVIYFSSAFFYVWHARKWKTAVDSSSACFACSNMRVSASSCVLYKLSISLQVSSVNLKHFLSQLTYMTLLRSLALSDCFCQSWAKNLIRLLLLLDEDKRRLRCFTLWPATISLKRIPLSDPRLTLSAFFTVHQGIHQIPGRYGNSLSQ